MSVVSSAPLPLGRTVAQTVVLFGIPPTESIPAICQFALALLSAGNRLPIMALSLPPELGDVGDKGSFPTLRAVLLGAVPTGRVASICPLFICQMVSEPVSWSSHMISLVPSPLKSPIAATTEFVGSFGRSRPLEIWPPRISQTAICPVAVLRQRISLVPSPLKSPTPTTNQSFKLPVTGRGISAATWAPFINQS